MKTLTTTTTRRNNKKFYLDSIREYIRDKEVPANKRMIEKLKDEVTELVITSSVLSKKLVELVTLLVQPEGDESNVTTFLETLYEETLQQVLRTADHCAVIPLDEIFVLMDSLNVGSKNSIYSMEIVGKGRVLDFFISRNTLNITTGRKQQEDTYIDTVQVYPPQQNGLEG